MTPIRLMILAFSACLWVGMARPVAAADLTVIINGLARAHMDMEIDIYAVIDRNVAR